MPVEQYKALGNELAKSDQPEVYWETAAVACDASIDERHMFFWRRRITGPYTQVHINKWYELNLLQTRISQPETQEILERK